MEILFLTTLQILFLYFLTEWVLLWAVWYQPDSPPFVYEWLFLHRCPVFLICAFNAIKSPFITALVSSLYVIFLYSSKYIFYFPWDFSFWSSGLLRSCLLNFQIFKDILGIFSINDLQLILFQPEDVLCRISFSFLRLAYDLECGLSWWLLMYT